MIDLPNYPVSAMIKKKALLLATLFLASAAPTLTGNLGIDADEPCDSGAPRAGQDGLGLGAYLGSRGPLALAGKKGSCPRALNREHCGGSGGAD